MTSGARPAPAKPGARDAAIERPRAPCYQGSVRPIALLSLILLGACPPQGGDTGGGECFVDGECVSGEVCARDGHCWPQAEVRRVETTWTLRGQPANATSCASAPNLHIVFDGNVSDDLGFEPVPCEIGQFVIDKLPRSFTIVELGVDDRAWRRASISSAGTASIDLPF